MSQTIQNIARDTLQSTNTLYANIIKNKCDNMICSYNTIDLKYVEWVYEYVDCIECVDSSKRLTYIVETDNIFCEKLVESF